jgi:hypothetical protein
MEALITKTIEEQIAERKNQEHTYDIFIKALRVVKALAKSKRTEECDSEECDEPYYTYMTIFNDVANALEVRHTLHRTDWEDAWSAWQTERTSVSIFFKGELVFDADAEGSTDRYVPGAWEAKLEAIYSPVQEEIAKKEEARAKEKAEAARRAECVKWGFAGPAHDVAVKRQQKLKNAARPSRLVK